MAVISALLLAMGVGRHYIDIWQKRTVRGISFLFVAIDAAGDLFSLLSLGVPSTHGLRAIWGADIISQCFIYPLMFSLPSYMGPSSSCGSVS